VSKRLHAFFWIAIGIPAVTLLWLVARVSMRIDSPPFTAQDAVGFAFLLLLGAGPVVALYGAAAFSRRRWFYLVAAGIGLLLSVLHPFVTWFGGGMALLGAGVCGWTVAFVVVSLSGAIRLTNTLQRSAKNVN
jgi:hypothetical protein